MAIVASVKSTALACMQRWPQRSHTTCVGVRTESPSESNDALQYFGSARSKRLASVAVIVAFRLSDTRMFVIGDQLSPEPIFW